MLKIQRFTCNMLQENCYVVSDESKECVICDCGAYYDRERDAVVNYIRGNGLTPVHLIATHGHIDHNFGNNTIYKEFGLQPEVHQADQPLMDMLGRQAEAIAGVQLDYIETPGHSPGSVFFYCEAEGVAFSGDTLFRHAIGRTDFIGGSMFQIIQSLRMVCQLPDSTVIYPGHGEQTTIGSELASNPYLDR